MVKFTYISERGDTLSLLENKKFKMTNFDGQTEADGKLSSVIIGSSDGDTVNNIYVQPRTITIDLMIIDNDVERTKREILNVVKLKQKGVIRWEQADKVLEITGIVESIEMPRWTKNTVMQITMHCSQPFWEDVDTIVNEVHEFINLHYFTQYRNDMLYFPADGIPFGEIDTTKRRSVNNTGDVSVGLEIFITALGTVTNPIIYADENRFFGVGYGDSEKQVIMSAGDSLYITTGKDNKTVLLNGVNMLGKIKPSSTWLQLNAGENVFAIDSDEHETDNIIFTLNYKRRYI